jgi:hypothetical protein
VILLSTAGEKEDLKLVSKVKGIDLVLVGYLPLKEEALTKVDETFFLRPGWQGRQLGKITLKIKDGKLADCNLEKLILTEKISDDSGIAAILPRCYSDVNCKDQELAGICKDPGALNARCLFVKPNPVNLSVISLKDCRTCNLELVLSKLRKQFPGLAINNLDYSQSQARKMVKNLGILTLPAFIFTKEVEQETGFDSLKDDLRLTNNFYVLKAQASGIAYFLDQEVKPGNFDLFISIFEKDSKLLLTTLREFNPVLHFLTVEKDGGFTAQHGVSEVEEYLRGVCVQKYYPEKFWDYLICRSQNIQSSYWEDCLDGLDTQSVKTCSRGQEGIDLLRKNNRLNEQLKISSGPSYLLDNREIFSSRGVPAKEELKRILKR